VAGLQIARELAGPGGYLASMKSATLSKLLRGPSFLRVVDRARVGAGRMAFCIETKDGRPEAADRIYK
jgi:hypothetical protein